MPTPKQICGKLKIDPVEVLALFAKGDVVRLKLMTQKELDDPGKLDKRTGVWIRLPGAVRALELIPPAFRKDAAKELAPYLYPKLAATTETVQDASGKIIDLRPKVNIYLPSNGR